MPRTYYIWDEVNDTLLMEKDEAGNTIAQYTHEPGQFGPLISQRRGGQTSYHDFDGQGSTRQLTDAGGNVTDSYTYTAFGEPVASSGTTTNPFGYKGALGYYVNPETSDIYVGVNSYQAALARWASRNRRGTIGAANVYNYVLENSVATNILSFPGTGKREKAGDPVWKPIVFLPGVKAVSGSVSCCVSARFGVKFEIPWDEVGYTGWVVQEIRTVIKVFSCRGADITAQYFEKPNLTFWEAFNLAHIWTRRMVPDPDDTYSFNSALQGTRGSLTTVGTAKGAANWDLPPDFVPGNVPEALQLPSTYNKPINWDMTQGTSHNEELTWDCCCRPWCCLMHTTPPWAVDLTVGPGASPECPLQMPITPIPR